MNVEITEDFENCRKVDEDICKTLKRRRAAIDMFGSLSIEAVSKLLKVVVFTIKGTQLLKEPITERRCAERCSKI